MNYFAEEILPGHPDRLADAIVELLVDEAIACDDYALVAVEAAINLDRVFLTGRIATAEEFQVQILDLVRDVYWQAGYRDRWQIEPIVDTSALILSSLPAEERAVRGYADDQNIVVGYACSEPAFNYLPPAVFLARKIRSFLIEMCREESEYFGPDGKILVHLEQEGSHLRWRRCNVLIQHTPRVSYQDFFQLITPRIGEISWVEGWDPSLLRINGGGDFLQGGPQGDNGLSGKKLVVDHYGACIPIGGGALCGKDPHKIDKCGALRARQVAVKLVKAKGSREAFVWLGYLPGQRTPDFLIAKVDGVFLTQEEILRTVHIPDLSIEGSFRQLNLGEVRWLEVLQKGYFGNNWAWDI